MKTLSGTLKVMTLLVIGGVAVFTLRALGQGGSQSNPNYVAKTFELRLQNAQFKNGDEKPFNSALQKFADAQVDVTVTHAAGGTSHYPPKPKVTLNMDKATESEMAQRQGAGDLTPIGTNVVTKVSSASAADITAVLDTMQ